MSAAPRRATYDDLLAVPDHLVAEILDGELIVSPRPAARHAVAGSAIGSVVFDRFNGPPGRPEAPGGWCVLFEPELHLDADVLVPDVAAWRRTRMPSVPDVAAFTLPPDWVCEVLSPRTASIDRSRKMPIYAREGVRHLWLVDPRVRTLEVYRLEAGKWVVVNTYAGDDPVLAEPFETLALDVQRWLVEEAAVAPA